MTDSNLIISISSRFFENQPNEICIHLSEEASKLVCFVRPGSSKIMETKERERRKRNSEEKERRRRKKAMFALLGFDNSYSWPEKIVRRKRSIWR